MRWRSRFLCLCFLIIAGAAVAQPSGAPPFFAGRSVLKNTDSLNEVKTLFRQLADSSSPIRILHLGDSHVKSGWYAEAFADSLNSYLLQAGATDTVQLTVMAKNGATSKYFLQEPYNAERVQHLQPHVVIISLGANEANNLYTQADLKTYFPPLLAQIKKDAPSAAIVFTTPGDAFRKTTGYVKKKKGSRLVTWYALNPVLPGVVQFVKDFAVANGAAYWDWYEVMGGRGAMARWLGHNYAKPDRVHLLENGYNLQGWLLATAFIRYLNN